MRVVAVHQEPGSTLDSLAGPIRERGHRLHEWRAWMGPPPSDLADAGAVIVLGGTANPDQTGELPWLARERQVLAELVEADVPVLGICLGAQMLASALGAPTARLVQAEIGWSEIAAAPGAVDDPLLGALPATFPAFEWHDYVFDLPDGAALLAGSAQAPHQAARLAEHAWALQFHIEVGAETIRRWTAEGRGELAEKGVDAARMLAETAVNAPAYVERARALGTRFLEVAERRAARVRALS